MITNNLMLEGKDVVEVGVQCPLNCNQPFVQKSGEYHLLLVILDAALKLFIPGL